VAVELVGDTQAAAIKASCGRGGNKECLREVLTKWWSSTPAANRNWQTIIDALKEINGTQRVIEDINDKCST